MFRVLLPLLLLPATSLAGNPEAEAAAKALVARVLPSQAAASIQITVPDAAGAEGDWFAVDNGPSPGTLLMSGNNAGSVASALNWYLKYTANASVSWSGDTARKLDALPPVDSPVRMNRTYKYGYYQNVCTPSYSMVWWDWERWEREIDWMAMNGVNAPLAFTGQEYVWYLTFQRFGLTYSDLVPFFSGPAFFAWQRMGNIKGWGGPLPQDFLPARRDLQLQILQRMRALGMTPILPAFAGHIPEAFVRKHNVSYSRSSDWNNFSDQYGRVFYLSNTDPMFVEVGKTFIEVQTSVYGTDHLYNADQYNEMSPENGTDSFLKSASLAMYSSMTAADPEAVWVMQGWLFVDDPAFWIPERVAAYLSGVPDDRMLVLDLFSEVLPAFNSTSSFFGKPFIWNMLHNFGGNLGLYGRMQEVVSGPAAAREANTSIVGVGITMEGIEQNYVMYELMLENAWRNASVKDLPGWVQRYSERRYGRLGALGVRAAWNTLRTTVYDAPATFQGVTMYSVTKSIVVRRPSLKMVHAGFMPTALFYDSASVVSAAKALLSDADGFEEVPEAYAYDLVDVTRQALSNLMLELNTNHTSAFELGDAAALWGYAQRMRQLLADLDTLLSSHPGFLLGTWLAAARRWGGTGPSNTTGTAYYEWNARNQLTLWGPHGEVADYASKQWGGLVRGYYAPRWDFFLTFVNRSLEAKQPFNDSLYAQQALQREQTWQHGSERFPVVPTGDPVVIARSILAKYF